MEPSDCAHATICQWCWLPEVWVGRTPISLIFVLCVCLLRACGAWPLNLSPWDTRSSDSPRISGCSSQLLVTSILRRHAASPLWRRGDHNLKQLGLGQSMPGTCMAVHDDCGRVREPGDETCWRGVLHIVWVELDERSARQRH